MEERRTKAERNTNISEADFWHRNMVVAQDLTKVYGKGPKEDKPECEKS